MGDVGLGVELVLVVDATLDLAGFQSLQQSRNSMQKRVGGLVGFDTAIEILNGPVTDSIQHGLSSSLGHLRSHQDANLLQGLPFAIEGEERADLEKTGGYVKALGNACPFFKVAEPGPAGDAVVDNEKVTALGFNTHLKSF